MVTYLICAKRCAQVSLSGLRSHICVNTGGVRLVQSAGVIIYLLVDGQAKDANVLSAEKR